MKISLLPSARRTLFCGLLLTLAPLSVYAQGNDNPTGVAGVFGPNSTTGCSYNPYTANAQRIIPDLTVAGAVGAYPLQWARIMNSRLSGGGVFGQAGGWRHSYQWSCSANESPTNEPTSYTVNYPDGRVVTFAAYPGTPYLSPAGVTDRFGGLPGNGYVYLWMTDGGKVRFYQTATYDHVDNYYTFTISLADQIIDPFGQVTTLNYDASNRLIKVTEPAGRYLTISYGTNGYVSEVDTYSAAGHWTQWVRYAYQTQTIGTWNGVVLTGATYIGSPTPTASYTYQTSNLSNAGTPLISTCRDVRYPGPMKNIKYAFVRTSPLSYGELSQEEDVGGTVVNTLTVTNNTRKEVRGDGTNAVRSGVPTRTFTYGAYLGTTGIYKAYLLKSYTDFRGNSTTLSYNADGFVSSSVDPKSHATSYQYLNQGFATGVITKITHPSGPNTPASNIQYFYTDATGAYLDHMIDELGHQTTYKRNSGTMTTYEIDYPDGGIEKYSYNGFGEVLTHTTPSTTITAGANTDSEKYTYDGAGLLLTYAPPATPGDGDPNPGQNPTRYAYDINDHVQTITDPRGNITTLYHNEIGQLTIVQHPVDNSLIGYTYNTDGTLQLINAQLNATDWAETQYYYDDYKRVTSVIDPMQHETDYYYGVNGGTGAGLEHADANVTRLVLPSAMVTQTLYDEDLRKGQVILGLGAGGAATTTYAYDAAGDLQTMVDPKGQSSGAAWTYTYDARDRLYTVTDPVAADRNSLGHTIDYRYDLASNKTSEQRANNQLITYDSYDPMNRLTQMTVQQAPTADAVTYYTWSNAGKILTMIDPNNHTYTYSYDRLNRLASLKYPWYNGIFPTESYLYDIASNLYQFTNRNGNVQTFTYDSRNRETYNSWDDGSTPSRTQIYDDASRVTTCNATGSNINFTYFADGRLKSQEEWTGYFGDNNHRTLTYTYNEDGLRASVALSGVLNLDYLYTPRNQLWTVTQHGNGYVYATYGYDLNGNMTNRQLYNGINSTFAYDTVNRLTDITHPFGNGSKTFHYDYNAVGNRTLAQRNGATPDSLIYDKNSQLTSFTPGGGTATTFNLDATGNRTSVNGVNYGINGLNEYTSVGGQSASYDNNGNVLTRYDASGTLWTYAYDALNRLKHASATGRDVYFYYDGLNRQIARYIPGQPVYFPVWDGWDMYTEYKAGNVWNRNTIHGAPDDLVGQSMSGVSTTYYFPDGLGSTSYLAGGNGNMVEQYTYDAYGTPTIYNSGGTVINASAYSADHLFTGRQWHPSIGLYDSRNRFYSPEWGRFLQPDPIGFAGDPANLYRYCGNNPANLSDPTGEDPVLHERPGGDYYSYIIPGSPDSFSSLADQGFRAFGPLRDHHYGPYQCAGIVQVLGGGYDSDGNFHDVPYTTYWFEGASLDSGLDNGTIVAKGWASDGGYPNDQVNHSLWLAYYDQANDAILYSGTKDDPIYETTVRPEDQWKYHEVDVAANNGPLGPLSQGDVITRDPDTGNYVYYARAVSSRPNTLYLNNGIFGTWGNPQYQAGSALSQYVPKGPHPKKKKAH
jgi:RHS repeat-associated protein